MAYGDFKDLAWRTASDKKLHDRAFDIAKNLKYDEYQRVLALMIYKLFDKKKTSGSGIEIENMSDQKLAEKLHKPIITRFEKIKSTNKFYRQYFGCWSRWYPINKQM